MYSNKNPTLFHLFVLSTVNVRAFAFYIRVGASKVQPARAVEKDSSTDKKIYPLENHFLIPVAISNIPAVSYLL